MNERLAKVLALIDQANSRDPRSEVCDDRAYPKELLYSRRMTAWLERLVESPTEAQRIAARAQHICRWSVPRDTYPRTRAGYRAWRSGLYKFHADKAAELMAQAEYDLQTIERVKKMIGKEGLNIDPDVQLIEDIACLVFIESYFLEFAKDYDEAKLVSIARKTWKKMSPQAQRAALALDLPDAAKKIIQKALA